jgi:MYXO-CTERM domain-containing protein
MRIRLATAVVFMLAATAASLPAADSRVYHVGNSLTGQAMGNDRLKNLAAPHGIDITYGFHIRCGEGVSYMWANPTDTCVDPNSFGRFADALPNNTWDIVTLQSYGDDLGAGRQAIANMINLARTNPANGATKFYVFNGWPQHLAGSTTTDYSDHWVRTYDRAEPLTYENRLLKWTRDYSDELMRQVNDDALGLPVEVYRVNTGEVFYQLDQLAEQGQLGSTTGIEQWYSDDYHMGEFGAYTSSITMLAALYGQSPIGQPAPAGMDAAVASRVQQTVWDVVRADPYSSVPEPGGALLLAFLAPLALRRRRA